jgi:hypothetical protein
VTPGSALFSTGVIALSVLLATVSYYCIEQPVLHTNWLLPHRPIDRGRARPVLRRAGLVGLGAVVVAAATVVAVTVLPADDASGAAEAAARAAAEPGGPPLTPLQQDIQAATLMTEWPENLQPSLADLPEYGVSVWPADCLRVDLDMIEHCTSGDLASPRRAVLLGDSYATAWVPAFRAGLVESGWSVVALSYGQCPNITAMTVLNGKEYDGCVEHRDWAIDYIVETRPDLVVLSNAWTATLLDDSLDRPTAYGTGLTEVIQRLQPSGARIVSLSAPPGSANLQTCPTALNGPDDCLDGPVDNFRTQVATEAQVAAATGTTAIDPEQWFCIDGRCPAVIGSTPVYFDGRHITVEYAERIGPDVVASLGLP